MTSAFLAGQLRFPSGPFAPVTAQLLNRNNRHLIEHAVVGLDVRPGHRVLDVGFGGGFSLRMLLSRIDSGLVAGVDASPEMVERAQRLYADEIASGRADIRRGCATVLPFDDRTFDRALAVQTVYFWPDLDAGIAELHRVLKPGSRLVVSAMPRKLQEHLGFSRPGYNIVGRSDLKLALEDRGFAKIGLWPPGAPRSWVIVAHRP